MWKELAAIAKDVSGWPTFLVLIAAGFIGFWRIADRKNNEMPRETRKVWQSWSGRLIGAGLILSMANFGLIVLYRLLNGN